ncbi:hypothetical protein PHAMO_80167 [Magnetospirillum molischianum DSM 120]|uniref:Uncharacterized protein n=1 Tax=Magnetospirillum molischianum DSM 120 TaxID=1150626 RepID=H8FYD8_MAGML|nr:hypothetical protein PHAMO_80167 [Magnetospirillum molischianum DSM 120]
MSISVPCSLMIERSAPVPGGSGGATLIRELAVARFRLFVGGLHQALGDPQMLDCLVDLPADGRCLAHVQGQRAFHAEERQIADAPGELGLGFLPSFRARPEMNRRRVRSLSKPGLLPGGHLRCHQLNQLVVQIGAHARPSLKARNR